MNTAGSKEALEIIEPFLKPHAAYSAISTLKMSKDCGYENCDDETYVLIGRSWTDQILRRTVSDIEFTASGMIGGEVFSCPFEKGIPEICSIMCEQLYNLIIHEKNTNCRTILTHTLTQGDDYCQWVSKGFSGAREGKKIVLIRAPQVSNEELDYWLAAWMGELWAIATNALVSFAGHDKAVEIMKPYMRQEGVLIGFNFSKMIKNIEKNAKGIASIIDLINTSLQQKGKFIANTPERVEKEIIECPFSGGTGEICADLLVIRSNGICEAINPEYEFQLNKRMCKGDKVCHWVVKKR